MRITPIDAIDDPRLADYANVQDAELLQRADPLNPGGLFMAEGEVVFRRLLTSPYATRSVLTTPTRLNTIRDALDTLPDETPIYVTSQSVMNGIVGLNMHRGLLAVGVRGPGIPLTDLLRTASLILVLENLSNHDNLGGIFRNAAAFGVDAVLLSPRCADPLYRKALRVSVGFALHIPFTRLTPWPEGLAGLREAGFSVLALTPDATADDIRTLEGRLRDSPRRLALLLGAEGSGLTAEAILAANMTARIPIVSGVDSLNVATAAAIALYQFTNGLPESGPSRVAEPG